MSRRNYLLNPGWSPSAGRPPAAEPPRAAEPKITRKDFADRLGLPANASNAEILAKLDAVLAQNAEDRLYSEFFGGQ